MKLALLTILIFFALLLINFMQIEAQKAPGGNRGGGRGILKYFLLKAEKVK